MSLTPPPPDLAAPPDTAAPAQDIAAPAQDIAAPPGAPLETAPPAERAPPDMPSLRRALLSAAVVTGLVTAVSWLTPKAYAATGVGLVFLASTWFLTLHADGADASIWGLSLGGFLDREPISLRRVALDAAFALLWAVAFAAVVFPPFYLGFRYFWHIRHPFVFHLPRSVLDDVAGQVFVIALPEEAFFRGYLQTALDASWPPRWRVFGAQLGPGWLVSAAIFAVGHVLTAPSPARLAVFFPALLFGFLRARTKGIGAGVAFHAACNLYSATLGRGFGLPT